MASGFVVDPFGDKVIFNQNQMPEFIKKGLKFWSKSVKIELGLLCVARGTPVSSKCAKKEVRAL